MIGNIKMCVGLYFLRVHVPKEKAQNISYVALNLDRIRMVLYSRGTIALGHPNFVYLKKSFLSLININEKFLQCDCPNI